MKVQLNIYLLVREIYHAGARGVSTVKMNVHVSFPLRTSLSNNNRPPGVYSLHTIRARTSTGLGALGEERADAEVVKRRLRALSGCARGVDGR